MTARKSANCVVLVLASYLFPEVFKSPISTSHLIFPSNFRWPCMLLLHSLSLVPSVPRTHGLQVALILLYSKMCMDFTGKGVIPLLHELLKALSHSCGLCQLLVIFTGWLDSLENWVWTLSFYSKKSGLTLMCRYDTGTTLHYKIIPHYSIMTLVDML